MNGFVRVRNLAKYQHYKDRNPPWIKLHRDLLEDYEFESLPDATKAHALLLLLLAARLENKIPSDPEWIARKIGARSPVDIESLVRSRFLERVETEPEHVASDTLAESKQHALAEGETEERQRRGRDRGARASAAPSPEIPTSLKVPTFEAAWSEWDEYRKQSGFKPWTEITVRTRLKEFESYGPEIAAAAIRQSIANGWRGIFCDKIGRNGNGAQPNQSAKRRLGLTPDREEAFANLGKDRTIDMDKL